MKSSDAVRIATKAINLLEEFCLIQHRRPQDLLPREGERISIELKEFAHSVVHSEHKTDWGTGNFLNAHNARYKFRLFVTADVRSLTGATKQNLLQGYGSWLWRSFPGCYAVVFDEHLIAKATPLTRVNQTEAITRLYLHELGHFVLHRDRLFQAPLPNSGCLASKAVAEMEDQAWFFAYVILGMARGDRAALTTAIVDNTWLNWP